MGRKRKKTPSCCCWSVFLLWLLRFSVSLSVCLSAGMSVCLSAIRSAQHILSESSNISLFFQYLHNCAETKVSYEYFKIERYVKWWQGKLGSFDRAELVLFRIWIYSRRERKRGRVLLADFFSFCVRSSNSEIDATSMHGEGGREKEVKRRWNKTERKSYPVELGLLFSLSRISCGRSRSAKTCANRPNCFRWWIFVVQAWHQYCPVQTILILLWVWDGSQEVNAYSLIDNCPNYSVILGQYALF